MGTATSRYEKRTETMKTVWIAIYAWLVAFCMTGCAHSPLNYPGSSASGINPSDYANESCPNFAGTYRGVGYLVDGDLSSKRSAGAQRLSFDMIFPITSDPKGWDNIQHNFWVLAGNHKFAGYADYAKVEQIGQRSVEITMGYKNRVIGSYRSDYKDTNKFICKDGKLMAGGPDRVSSRSEWGKNYSERSFIVYKNDAGDIICETHFYVHMTWLDVVPTGTAKYYTKYIFKRLKK